MRFHKGLDGFYNVIEHLARKPGISPDEECFFHDAISARKLANYTESSRAVFPELDQDGLANKVPAEEHPVADLFLVEVTRELELCEGSGWFDPEHEAEPGADRAVTGGIPRKSFGSPGSCVRRQHEIE